MITEMTGGCNCKGVRYRTTGEPVAAAHCQCRTCQRETGTGHSSHVVVPAATVTIEGEVREYRTRSDSGAATIRGFCPVCGSSLLFRTSSWPEMLFLTAGTLDDPGRFAPTLVVFTAHAQPWDAMDPALHHFPGMPHADG